MTDKPNFVLVRDDTPPAAPPPPAPAGGGLLSRVLTKVTTVITSAAAALPAALTHAELPADIGTPSRPRLVFAVDATASREPAWAAARQVTDVLVKALPGELDVAVAVHGGSFACTSAPPCSLKAMPEPFAILSPALIAMPA